GILAFFILSMDISTRDVGDPCSRVCCPQLLPALLVSPGCFYAVVAIMLGTVIRPVVTWLHLRGLSRRAGVILVYLLLLALFAGFVLLLFPLIVDQGRTIAAATPGYYQSLRAWMGADSNQLIVRLSEFLPAVPPVLEVNQQSGPQMLAIAGQTVGYLTAASYSIFMATAILLLAFHWTLNGPRTIQSLLLLAPQAHREPIGELIAAMETKIGYYIAGEGALCLSIAAMALVAYLIIGLPNALVLALVAGVMEVVPLVGPFLGAVPAAVIALSIDPSKLLWVIAATLVIQQLEGAVLVPRVMRKAMGVNPFVSLLAIFAFSSMFGIAGALMAVPIAAMIQLLLDHFLFQPTSLETGALADRDYASRLRYEAQELAQGLRKQARVEKGGSEPKVRQIDQVMDEIETIATELDALLEQAQPAGAP
ncbi:MAG TPA: AI-2E family transporter, partial [Caldilinea sp.]|nr:AI-2E family transporter [Caldilinea sp.]